MNKKTIRWVLAHEPQDIFLRAAQRFADRVHEASHGQLEVEILGLTEYAEKYNNGVTIFYPDLVQYLNEGKLEMTQMYTHALGSYSRWFRVLDLPFLFDNDEHASRTLDGEIGKTILNTLNNNQATENIKGLAFTYSGGFTVISTDREINSVEDLAGLKVRVPHSPVIADYFSELGMEPVMLELSELNSALSSRQIDAAEITYRRLYEAQGQHYTNAVLHSHHTLFLTSILINEDFWDTLGPELQDVIAQAAMTAAQQERDEAVEDDQVHQGYCLDDGITVSKPNAVIEQQLRERGQRVYDKYQSTFGTKFVSRIRNN